MPTVVQGLIRLVNKADFCGCRHSDVFVNYDKHKVITNRLSLLESFLLSLSSCLSSRILSGFVVVVVFTRWTPQQRESSSYCSVSFRPGRVDLFVSTSFKMGNEVSQQEDDRQFHEEAVTKNGITLESPEADKYLNRGTAASNCQPSHTQSELNKGQNLVLEEGLEVVMKDRNEDSENGKPQPLSPKHRRDSGMSDSGQDERRKRQHMTEQEQQQAAAKKLTYVQMAKMGYQELVNAIIRPPRADYKVSSANVM